MIRIYPYPFSKYVKSLPDPPPGKSRKIKDFESKRYENDYSWLLKAKNNLKKCFHLCNTCSKKFNYMNHLVKNSNVYYEYNLKNNIIVSNKLKENLQFKENIYDFHLSESNKSNNTNNELYDEKNIILKINNHKHIKKIPSNISSENINTINNNSIIFSNSLNRNGNESLSFSGDIYIFIDDYNKKDSKSYKKNEEKYIYNSFENLNTLKHDDNILSKHNPDDMIIHIKRHLKNNISYFACEHIKECDLYDLNVGDNNYDNINTYMYDDREYSMSDCIINFMEENELYNLPQLDVINGIDEEDKYQKKENTNMKDIHDTKLINMFCLNKSGLNVDSKNAISNNDNDINNIEESNEHLEFENSKLYNGNKFYNNKTSQVFNSVKEKVKLNNNILQINKDGKDLKDIDNFSQNDKKNEKLKYYATNKCMNFKKCKDYHENEKNDSGSFFDENFNDNIIDCNNKNQLLPLCKIYDGSEENINYLNKKEEFDFNNFLKKKKNYGNYKNDSMDVVPKDDDSKNNEIMENHIKKTQNYGNQIKKNHNNENNFEKYNTKKVDKTLNFNKERTPLTLIDELNKKFILRKNLYLENNIDKNYNISAHEEKEKIVVDKSMEGDIIIHNIKHTKDALQNEFSFNKQNTNLLNIYKKNNIDEKKTINNVNINEFKNKFISDMNLLLNTQENILQKSIVLDNERKKSNENKKINSFFDDEYEKNITNANTCCFKEVNNFISNESNVMNTKIENFKNIHKEIKNNLALQNYNVKIKQFNAHEKEKMNNIKSLKQTPKNICIQKNKTDENKIKGDLSYLNGKQTNQTFKKIYIECVDEDGDADEGENEILDANKNKKYNKEKNIDYNQSKFIKNKEETIDKDIINKVEHCTNENSSNPKDVYKRSTNAIFMNKENTDKKTLNETKNENNNKSYYKNNCNNNNADSNINNMIKSNISKNNIYDSLIKNFEHGIKNCENFKIKNQFTENNLNYFKGNKCVFNTENLNISKKNVNHSPNNWNISEPISIKNKKNSNNINLNNNNKEDLIVENKLDNDHLKNKKCYRQNKGVNTEYNNICDRLKESDKLYYYKHLNNEQNSDDNLIYNNTKKEVKQQKVENEINEIGCEEAINNKLKKKIDNILNLCINPNKINIYNKIYAHNIKKNNNDNDNKQVICINNNYFFNEDKDNYFENTGKEFPGNSMKYNFKKVGLQLCKDKNDLYSFKYMSNVLSSSCSLSKEYLFSESFESNNILQENFGKLNDHLRNKYLLKKYLNKALDKKGLQFTNNTDKQTPNINIQKLKYDMKKNIYDQNFKIGNKFNTTEKNFSEALNTKQRISKNFKMNKINVNLCEAPKSPKKQEKIPKPLASQLKISTLSCLKKTPSYPFEEFNF